MEEVEYLAKEVPQVGTGVELTVVVYLVEMTEGMSGGLGDVLGVTQYSVEVKNYEGFVPFLKSTC